VQANGSWQVTFSDSKLAEQSDGATTLTLEVEDQAGNPASSTTAVTIDRVAAINLLPVAGDGWINSSERNLPLTLSGLVAGIADGQTLTLTITAQGASSPLVNTTVTVNDGAFSYAVPSIDWTAWHDLHRCRERSRPLRNGAASSRSFSADFIAPSAPVKLQIGSQSPQDLATFTGTINAADLLAGVWLSGEARADAASTSLTVGSNPATLVNPVDGLWRLALDATRFQLPAQGPLTITTVTSDQAGNSKTETNSLQLDHSAVIRFSDGAIDGNNSIINATEAPALTIAGHTVDVQDGATVSVQGVERQAIDRHLHRLGEQQRLANQWREWLGGWQHLARWLPGAARQRQ
jgi:hypothetical protein